MPTVVSPEIYRTRFCEAMNRNTKFHISIDLIIICISFQVTLQPCLAFGDEQVVGAFKACIFMNRITFRVKKRLK